MSTNISKEFIAHYLPKNPVIVEAGAHIGRDTKKMLMVWPQATIHAFEPVPELFEILKQNTAHCSNVICYPYALSNTTGTAPFHVSSGRSTATSSLLAPKEYLREHPSTHFETIQVKTITLADWSKEYSISHVDFLWLDMQGGELLALEGASMLLHTIKVIHTEINLIERYANNPSYEHIKTFLGSYQFHIIKETFNPTWGNVLLIKNIDHL